MPVDIPIISIQATYFQHKDPFLPAKTPDVKAFSPLIFVWINLFLTSYVEQIWASESRPNCTQSTPLPITWTHKLLIFSHIFLISHSITPSVSTHFEGFLLNSWSIIWRHLDDSPKHSSAYLLVTRTFSYAARLSQATSLLRDSSQHLASSCASPPCGPQAGESLLLLFHYTDISEKSSMVVLPNSPQYGVVACFFLMSSQMNS